MALDPENDKIYIELEKIQEVAHGNILYLNPLLYVKYNDCLLVKLHNFDENGIYYIEYSTRDDSTEIIDTTASHLYSIKAYNQDLEGNYFKQLVKPSQWVDLYNLGLYNTYVNFDIKHSNIQGHEFVIQVDLSQYNYQEIIELRNKNFYKTMNELNEKISRIEEDYDIKLTTLDTVRDSFMTGLELGRLFPNKLTEKTKLQLWKDNISSFIEDSLQNRYTYKFNILLSKSLDKIINNGFKIWMLFINLTLNMFLSIALVHSFIDGAFDSDFGIYIISSLFIINTVFWLYYLVIKPTIINFKK